MEEKDGSYSNQMIHFTPQNIIISGFKKIMNHFLAKKMRKRSLNVYKRVVICFSFLKCGDTQHYQYKTQLGLHISSLLKIDQTFFFFVNNLIILRLSVFYIFNV
eukprot:NODE_623_length_1319_cov_10.528523_g584_i0.p3 GENE.NODE_623_length_1319_cov_10.528523_g584_i0~~NODE_623_length_1319_cov_10.528523_g584_i0.p3  ORF type:complete len:104 (+),score=7.28 NODE_623_length_1319_cov_10.528523_g584_i0:735-1046(+)